MVSNMEKKQTPVQELMQEAREAAGELRLIRRRSSILPRVNSDPLEINDDSVERGRARHESAASSSPASTHSRRSLNIGAVAQFTGPQLAAGVAECIKLNAENKITKKNAFSLKMIDFMTFMVKNHDDGMSNLLHASTTLDVSTKIYGLRVDVLHQDTMNIVGSLEDQSQNPDETPADANTSMENLQPQVKPKRKKKPTQVLPNLDSLCGETEMIKLEPPMLGDGDHQTSDMLLQMTAPRHVGLGLGIHPYNDLLLDTPGDKPESEKITINPIDIPEGKTISVIFRDFEFLNWDETYAPDNPVQAWSQQNAAAPEYDLNASIMSDDEDGFHHEEPLPYDDGDGEMMEAAPAGLRLGNRQGERLVDATDLLEHATFANDYSFFDEKSLIDIRWKSGSQWMVKNDTRAPGNAQGQRREVGRAKRDFVVDFWAEWIDDFEAKFTAMKRVVRKARPTMTTFLRPEDSEAEPQELFKFGIRPYDTHLKPRRRAVEGREPGAGNPLPEDFNLNLTDHDDYDQGGHDDIGELGYDMSEPSEHEDFPSQGGFTGTNLVEAPKLTEKIYIAYSQRAKKLDMRHLKKCIWESVGQGQGDDKENEKTNDQENKENEEQKVGPAGFDEVYNHLPEKLNKNDAKELSFPIAFVSLLHLANEKKLKLMPNDDLSDIIITVDDAE